jgi:hypothetical protein
MRPLIFIILLILPNILFANEKYTIKAIEKSSYRLTENGFVTYDLPPDSWVIDVENSNYFLVLRGGKVALEIMKSDENVILLKQPSNLSGYRIFTFFKKSHKFSITETGYVYFPEEALKLGYMSEDISVSFGSYKVD